MTFINAILLFGLFATAIPIIIHILNRRRAAVVDWGAMKFLEEFSAKYEKYFYDFISMLKQFELLEEDHG